MIIPTFHPLLLVLCFVSAVSLAQVPLDADSIKAEADSLKKTGHFYRDQKRELEKSISYYQQALEKYLQIDFQSGVENVNWQIGVSYYYLSKYNEALNHFQRSLKILRENGDKQNESYTLNYIGLVYKSLSNYPKALDYYEQSLNLRRQLSDKRGEALTLSNTGVVYVRLKDFDRALEYYFKSLEIRRQLGDKKGMAQVLNNIGIAYDELKNYSRAIEYYQQSLEISWELGETRTVSQVLNNIGVAYFNQKDYSQVITYYNESLSIFRQLDDCKSMGLTLLNIGEVYKRMEDFETAWQYIERGRETLEELDSDLLRFSVYDAVADWQVENGEDSLAVDTFSKAIEILEGVREKLQIESQKRSYASGSYRIYESIVLALHRLGRYEEAFNYIERSRARSFLDLLGEGNVKVGKAQHRKFLEGERSEATSGAGDMKHSSIQHDIHYDARGIILPQDQKIDIDEPELISMVSVSSLNLSEAQELIPAKCTVLEYFLTQNYLITFAITRKGYEVFKTKIPVEIIKQYVSDFRGAIIALEDVDSLSQELYKYLIAPAEKAISGEDLVIIPYGLLHYTPFSALMDAKGRLLVEKYRISLLPSASVMKYLLTKHRNGGRKLLAMGNPAFGNSLHQPLPYSEREVKRIGDYFDDPAVYVGVDASEARFKEQSGDYDILHLACHADLNSAYPMFSGLLLTPGEGEDGELDVHELFSMELNANLVVLSACQTGLGKLTSGDELVGLSRAFFYAGTPSLISSLWMVEDESTEYLMGRFYRYLKRYDKAESLRRAQLDTRKKYRHPRSWASFQLIGDADGIGAL